MVLTDAAAVEERGVRPPKAFDGGTAPESSWLTSSADHPDARRSIDRPRG